MTTRQAAKVIGCSPQHVRTLIRAGKLKAEAYESPQGYVYDVSHKEVNRYKQLPTNGPGRPRGPVT